METAVLQMDRAEARQLYEKYQGAIHYGHEMDREIARAYRLLAQGKLIIRALESVRIAGLNEDGLPKLAIIRADSKECWLRMNADGSATFQSWSGWRRNATGPRCHMDMPAGTFANARWVSDKRAIVPLIPLHLRPKADLSNYHILWEADWRAVPRDPFLLRRLGKGDLWVVLAAWDLTEVEREAMRVRV